LRAVGFTVFFGFFVSFREPPLLGDTGGVASFFSSSSVKKTASLDKNLEDLDARCNLGDLGVLSSICVFGGLCGLSKKGLLPAISLELGGGVICEVSKNLSISIQFKYNFIAFYPISHQALFEKL
jgi:hypothetical protein